MAKSSLIILLALALCLCALLLCGSAMAQTVNLVIAEPVPYMSIRGDCQAGIGGGNREETIDAARI